jgi:hypothetical protein
VDFIHPSLTMDSASSKQLDSEPTQQPATQQLLQVPHKAKKHFKRKKKTIGRLSSKKKPKVNKSLAASDVLVPPLPNSVPLAAAHPQQEVPLAFPLNLVPPVVLEQPLAPPIQQQQNKL